MNLTATEVVLLDLHGWLCGSSIESRASWVRWTHPLGQRRCPYCKEWIDK